MTKKKYKYFIIHNPYWRTTRWIKHAFGYDQSRSNHKILRFDNSNFYIYNFSSNSWNTPDATLEKNVELLHRPNLNLKGNSCRLSTDIKNKNINMILHSLMLLQEMNLVRLCLCLCLLILIF